MPEFVRIVLYATLAAASLAIIVFCMLFVISVIKSFIRRNK